MATWTIPIHFPALTARAHRKTHMTCLIAGSRVNRLNDAARTHAGLFPHDEKDLREPTHFR